VTGSDLGDWVRPGVRRTLSATGSACQLQVNESQTCGGKYTPEKVEKSTPQKKRNNRSNGRRVILVNSEEIFGMLGSLRCPVRRLSVGHVETGSLLGARGH